MTARGVDFLEDWVSGKLPPMPVGDTGLIKSLAQKLRDDSAAAGFTRADLEIEEVHVEAFIQETLVHISEPGMPGD